MDLKSDCGPHRVKNGSEEWTDCACRSHTLDTLKGSANFFCSTRPRPYLIDWRNPPCAIILKALGRLNGGTAGIIASSFHQKMLLHLPTHCNY